jgi:hypothetical protein
MRQTIFRAFSRYRPSSRVKIQLGPSHPENLAASLAGQQSQTEYRRGTRVLALKRTPKGFDLFFGKHAVTLALCTGVINARSRVNLDDAPLDAKVENLGD